MTPDPYRQMVPIVQTKKKVVGLIVVPYKKPPPLHECKRPSLIWRDFCFWLPKFAVGTMFRCPKCKAIWRLCDSGIRFYWTEGSIEHWKEAGGAE
jgi:hypothetical protein